MPNLLGKKTLSERYTPTEIRLSKLYQRNMDTKKNIGSSVANSIKDALRRAGYEDEQIAKIVTHDKPQLIKQMREVANILNQAQIYGFKKDQEIAIKQFLNKERVKAQSIARIRKEHILEASEEGSPNYSATTLSQKSQSPNKPKPGEAAIPALQRTSSAARSLSGKGISKTISSFGGRAEPSSSLTQPAGAPSPAGGGVSFRPKF
jgi:hypothetical protein